MKNKLFIKLANLCDQITAHPELNVHLNSDLGIPLLPLEEIVNGFIDASDEFRALLSDLQGELGDLFIADDGGETKAFLTIRQYGYTTSTEVSAFTMSLSGLFGDKSGKWFVLYG